MVKESLLEFLQVPQLGVEAMVIHPKGFPYGDRAVVPQRQFQSWAQRQSGIPLSEVSVASSLAAEEISLVKLLSHTNHIRKQVPGSQ